MGLSDKTEEIPGLMFIMHLFFKEKCDMPEKAFMISTMQKHLGKINCFYYSDESAGFEPKRYTAKFNDKIITPQLMITRCMEADSYKIDEITKRQMWDCDNSEEILSTCNYQIVATDMLAGGMDYQERAEMLMDYMEALVEMYPQCVAVQFQTSGKMFTTKKIKDHEIAREIRFIYFAVNVRFFNIKETEDYLVDSLGMSTLFLPDLQYHFHGMEPSWVMEHAYNMLSYIYDNNCPIENGDTIDGITDGNIDEDIQWSCQFEDALIQPKRPVLDVCMGEYASGR